MPHTNDSGPSKISTFSNNSNVTINNGSFVAAETVHFHAGNHDQRGLEILQQYIAVGATYDAAERGDPPKCHPKTRTAILDYIKAWIHSPPAHRKFILWLYGPAGAGKSAIAQTIAEMCAKDDILAASFFFFRTAARRNTSFNLIATLGYQLAISIPTLRDYILLAVQKDPTILERRLATQMQELILKPINEALLAGTIFQSGETPQLVILDGLDECDDESEQQEILDVLASSVAQFQRVPLIFLIASRPDYTIRTFFNNIILDEITAKMVLDHDYQTDEDIKLYLNHSFDNLRDVHPAGRSLPQHWPTLEQMEYLVYMSSGQFIYASTVVKFIASPRHSLVKRLKTVLRMSTSGDDTPFAQLDTLYRHILSSVQDLPKVLEIIGFLLLLDLRGYHLRYQSMSSDIGILEYLLGYDAGEIHTALVDMHALVFISDQSRCDELPKLGVYHASLHDFLVDPSRSKEYAIDVGETHKKIAIRLLKTLQDDPKLIFASQTQRSQLEAAMNSFVSHAKNVPPVEKEVITPYPMSSYHPIHPSRLQHFLQLPWIEFFGCLERLGLTKLEKQVWDQISDWIFGQLEQHSDPIPRLCATALCAFPIESNFSDIYNVLLHGAPSIIAQEQLQNALMNKRDDNVSVFQRLCGPWYSTVERPAITIMIQLFVDPNRAGPYLVSSDSFLELSAHIIGLISQRHFSIRGRTNHQDLHTEHNSRVIVRIENPDLSFLSTILEKSSKSAAFVELLHSKLDHWEEYEDFISEAARENLVKFSQEYIERCRGLHTIYPVPE